MLLRDDRPVVHVKPGFTFKLILFYLVLFADIVLDAVAEPTKREDFTVHMLLFRLVCTCQY